MSNEVDQAERADIARDPHPVPRSEENSPPATRQPRQGQDRSKDGGAASDQDQQDSRGHKAQRRRWPLVLLIGAVLILIAGSLAYWYSTLGFISTDDAYTDGNSIVIAPKVAGYVMALSVSDNSFVKAADLLYKIDPRDYIASRDQARANLDMARAQLSSAVINLDMTRVKAPANLLQAQAQLSQSKASRDQAERNNSRQHSVDPRATTQVNIDQATAQLRSNQASVDAAQASLQVSSLVQQNIDTAQAQVKQAEGQVAQAEANLYQAEVNLSYTEIRAPQDGRVTQRSINLGNYVQAGQQSFYLVTPQVWVTANYKETQLDEMRPGQPVEITVDAYPNLKLGGHVDSIQQGSGAQFSAFPAQNATGNFVKIVRRVPVKLVIDRGLPDGPPLPLGISVVATVNTR